MPKQSITALEELKKIRRILHQYPEIGFKEFNTQKFIIDYLASDEVQISQVGTGVLIFFDFGYPETYAFRAEEDALNIIEEGIKDYKSKNEGIMHACGHDGHMAILLVFGKYLTQRKIKPKHNILLIFQPAEELVGGALSIVNSGLYHDIMPSKVFALHLYPGLQENKLYSCGGPFLAKCVEIDIEIVGRASHVSKQDDGIDAIRITNLVLDFIYDYFEKNENKSSVFLIGKIQCGNARNIVADYSKIYLTLRNHDESVYIRQKKEITNFINYLIYGFNLNIKISFNEGVPALVNDSNLFLKVKNIIEMEEIGPQMIGDDFSIYQSKGKILYTLLGINSSSLHTSSFDFDEKVLLTGLNYYIDIIEKL